MIALLLHMQGYTGLYRNPLSLAAQVHKASKI